MLKLGSDAVIKNIRENPDLELTNQPKLLGKKQAAFEKRKDHILRKLKD